MSDTDDILEKHASRRRDFLKKSGKIAVAAPAVALLLQAGVKPAFCPSLRRRPDANNAASVPHHHRRPPLV
jgi:hypothetical protein